MGDALTAEYERIVLALEMCAEDDHADADGRFPVPSQIHIGPGGEVWQGRDGREFRMRDAATVLERTEQRMGDRGLMLDRDHESMSYFGTTVASGWISALHYVAEDESGGRKAGWWGDVGWTPQAREDIALRRFRGLSPTLMVRRPDADAVDEEAIPEVLWFENVALTNTPNLAMTALNSARKTETAMNEETRKAMAAALGLPGDATVQDVELAYNAAKGSEPAPATAAAPPEPAPAPAVAPTGSDLEQALQRAATAEAQLAANRTKVRLEDVSTTLQSALKAGKIAPASLDHYRGLCATDAGLKGVKALLKTLPNLVATDTTADPPSETGDLGLTANQIQIAENIGMTPAAYAEQLKKGGR